MTSAGQPRERRNKKTAPKGCELKACDRVATVFLFLSLLRPGLACSKPINLEPGGSLDIFRAAFAWAIVSSPGRGRQLRRPECTAPPERNMIARRRWYFRGRLPQ